MTQVMKRLTIGLVSISLLAGLAVFPVVSTHVKSAQQIAKADDNFGGPIDPNDPCGDCGAPIEPEQPCADCGAPIEPEQPCDCGGPIIEVPGPVESPTPVDIPREEFGNLLVIKFKDVNGNGIEDAGEPRMSGVAFHLDNQGAISTNGNGEILWTNLHEGSHQVREDVLNGFVVTTPNPVTVFVNVNATAVVKFGNKPVVTPQRAILEVVKFKDVNGDGSRDTGEPAMSGILFTLKFNGNTLRTGTSNEAGVVEFTDLEAGTYSVEESLPAGFIVTTPNPQSATLVANDHKTLFFGNKPVVTPQQKGNIKVIKFRDDNGNGAMDTGEGRLSGVTFTVNGGMLKTTDANGEARWIDLALATYSVSEGVPAGFIATTATTQTANLTADGLTVTLLFGNKPVTPPTQLPQTGAMEVLIPTSVGFMGTLYTMVRRQRRYMVDLLRNL